MDTVNPFALVRASEFTDDQINDLWVELGPTAIDAIIEPRSKISKYILGGKGTGKTHLLRYHSYPVARLRAKRQAGIPFVQSQKFLAVFFRTTGVDSARFGGEAGDSRRWQQLFSLYLELRLVELVLDALDDVRTTSPDELFDDVGFVRELSKNVHDPSFSQARTFSEVRGWIVDTRRNIDAAVDNAAFTDTLEVRIPFSTGAICLALSRAIGKWNQGLFDVPLIYLVDEIENLSLQQQQVVNTFIRYGEGQATFRVTGRLYARKTFSTVASGEENREGAEFKTTVLDDLLRNYKKYPAFAKKFVAKRLASASLLHQHENTSFDPADRFEEVKAAELYSAAIDQLRLRRATSGITKEFEEALGQSIGGMDAAKWAEVLTDDFPPVLQKLNLLIFCKKYKAGKEAALAKQVAGDCRRFLLRPSDAPAYKTAYGHYAGDLFAQLCREANSFGVPYAGFDLFVRMSSGNPRNLLVSLGRVFALAIFKEVNFVKGPKVPLDIQTDAAQEAARFIFESDTNFGGLAEVARMAVTRLATLLRTARYALKVPESSPLVLSFSDADLNAASRQILSGALNYSLLFELQSGRPDRNSERLNRKIQLNPMLSPRWGLPVSGGGDLGLSKEMVNAIFDPDQQQVFDYLLRSHSVKWNRPFGKLQVESQARLL